MAILHGEDGSSRWVGWFLLTIVAGMEFEPIILSAVEEWVRQGIPTVDLHAVAEERLAAPPLHTQFGIFRLRMFRAARETYSAQDDNKFDCHSERSRRI
ncbi:MAG: hypothetical protein WAL84_15060, partial [Candidatus Dormiibacterota bacterium]